MIGLLLINTIIYQLMLKIFCSKKSRLFMTVPANHDSEQLRHGLYIHLTHVFYVIPITIDYTGHFWYLEYVLLFLNGYYHS